MLQMALVGYRRQREKLDEQIADIERRLGGGKLVSIDSPISGTPQRRRQMSAAAIARIREAQKKRWAAFRKEQDQTGAKANATAKRTAPATVIAKKVAPKRKMSPERRKALIENLKKARAARAAKARRAA